ncbi:MAG: hypothetical protein QOG21_276 [Actinomycetota bacterium]|jgi:hypothetical protein|nr:hypothetical protein [Actinomycetota bacterium]
MVTQRGYGGRESTSRTLRAISGNLPTETDSHDPRSGPLGPPVCCLYFGAERFLLEHEVKLAPSS